ncbi:unnamed protein product [Rhizoctonia solani]|uniref:Uncharacterized protein n=1 Tax=Rhizoctonia solani TaxID=456999 RepID=A0A8H3H8A6_9AGAM|nr:unnamed protein product [Rhizoctonia solani]
MGRSEPSNFAGSCWTNASAHTASTASDFPCTSVSSTHLPLPSRIPRLSRRAMSNSSFKNVPRYMKPTLTSSQRQRAPRPKRSSPGKGANKASYNPPTGRVSRKPHMSKIPVLSRRWIESALARITLVQDTQVCARRVPTSRLTARSPPPRYRERPEPPAQFNAANLFLSSPSPPSQCLPAYLEHPSTNEVELFVCPYPSEGLEDSVATTFPQGRLAQHRPGTPLRCRRDTISTPRARAAFTKGRTNRKATKFPLRQCRSSIPNSAEELSEDPDLDELSCAILEDIFFVSEPIASSRAVVLAAYVRNRITSS